MHKIFFHKKLLNPIICFFISLGMLETGAHLIFSWQATEDEQSIIREIKYSDNDLVVHNCVPHPYALYMPKPDFFAHGMKQHNSLGFRGREIDVSVKKYRIACLGGSTTYSWTVKDPEYTYPRLMEKQLLAAGKKIEVINAGLPMGTSAEILTTFHFRVLPLKPKLVILHTGLNDVFSTLMPDYKPDYTHDRHSLTIQSKSFIRKFNFLLNSNIVQLMALGYLRKKGFIEGQASYVNPDHWNTEYWKTGETEDPQRYIGFRNNLRSLLAICERNNISVVISPDNILEMPEYPALVRAYQKNVEIMRELAGEFSNAVFFDSQAINIPKNYFDDQCHLNRKGEELKAKAFAKFILDQGFLVNE